MSEWLQARNLLAIRPDNIGDVIMTAPALRAVKETSPNARLTLLASPAGATAAPLLPWVDDVIVWRPLWQDVRGDLPFDPDREYDLIQTIAERQFDGALIFTSFSQTPHVPGYVCYLAGIPQRAGESKEFAGSTLTHNLPPAPDTLHQTERNLRLIESLGFNASERNLTVAIGDQPRDDADAALISAGIDLERPFVVLHPGASAEARRFPPERMGEVARLLRSRGWQIVVTGTEREFTDIDIVRRVVPDAAFLAGATPLDTYAAILHRAALVICGNTLPMHLSDAVGTPLVVLFSGTDYESQWQPRNVEARLLRHPTSCSPCYLFQCPIGKPCLDIAPETVVDAAETLLVRTMTERHELSCGDVAHDV